MHRDSAERSRRRGSATRPEQLWQPAGRLRIEGRRLDASASPLRAEVPDGYGDLGFQASSVIFPTPGCWEVTGRVNDASVTFVTKVTKIADGPGWRRDVP
jgi:hypothetical protein